MSVSSTTREKQQIRQLLRSGAATSAAAGSSPEFDAANAASGEDVCAGVAKLGEFQGYARCTCVIENPHEPALASTVVWCAEADGSIRIRSAATGFASRKNQQSEKKKSETETNGEANGGGQEQQQQKATRSKSAGTSQQKSTTPAPLHFIPPVPRTYVSCMCQVDDEVYVGYTDSIIRAYSVHTLQLTWEKKRHCGGVTVLYFFMDHLFSGSDDFQIVMWDVGKSSCNMGYPTTSATGSNHTSSSSSSYDRRPLHQFSGHTNRIRSLFSEGKFLFSASDDGYVRCWNVEERREATGFGYPLLAQKGGVKTACVSDGVLFTGGSGGVSLHNVESAELIHQFRILRSNMFVQSLAVVEATVTLWAASSDGVITVWDLFTFDEIGTIRAHASTIVNTMNVVARSVASRVLVTTPTTLTCQYSESEGFTQNYDPFPPELKEMQQRIDDFRTQIVQNSSSIRERLMQLRRLKSLDEHRRKQIADALFSTVTKETKRSYMNKVRVWMNKKRAEKKKQTIADCMRSTTIRGLMSIYLAKLGKYSNLRKDQRKNKALASSLLRSTSHGLQIVYMHHLVDFATAKAAKSNKSEAVQALLKHTTRGLQSVYLNKLFRFRLMQKALAKRKFIVESLLQSTRKGTMVAYWGRFSKGVEAIRRIASRNAAAESLLSTTQRGTRLVWFEGWKKALATKKHHNKKKLLADAMGRQSANGLTLIYYKQLLAHCQWKKQLSFDEKLKLLQERVAELDGKVNDPNLPAEEELDKSIAEVSEEIAASEKELESVDSEVKKLEDKEKGLQMELSSNKNIDTSKPLANQVDQLSLILKPNIISCRYHLSAISAVHKKFEAKPAAAAPAARRSSTPSSPTKSPSASAATAASDGKIDIFVDAVARTRAIVESEVLGQKHEEEREEKQQETATATATAGGEEEQEEEPKEGDDQEKKEEGEEKQETEPSSPEPQQKEKPQDEEQQQDEKEAETTDTKTQQLQLNPGEFWPLENDAIAHAKKSAVASALDALRDAMLAWDHIQSRKLLAKATASESAAATTSQQELVNNATWLMELAKRAEEFHTNSNESVVNQAAASSSPSPAAASGEGAKKPAAKRTSSAAAGSRTGTASSSSTRTGAKQPAAKRTTTAGTKPASKTSSSGK